MDWFLPRVDFCSSPVRGEGLPLDCSVLSAASTATTTCTCTASADEKKIKAKMRMIRMN
eukprot:CAMPEP_0117494290 /NCGR_PEP_ID=MMETSP0784-20121206/19536_1 /TAXON_ID=39447 /ORGANISM="" /LENGTH=58 /DNA_ID=CAMNT_0005289167 /DNA_START=818 /DNA_END=994 /DNA_ORIENTATION=-